MDRLKRLFTGKPSFLIITILLLGITILAAFLRFYQIGKLSLWNDELDTVRFTAGSFKDMLLIIKQSQPNMGLYYLFIHYWILVFPNYSDGILRIPSAIFSIASIPVVFLLGKEFCSNKKQSAFVGLLAALLVSINTFHIQYSQELRSYSLVFLLTTLSTYFLIKAVERPNSFITWTFYIFACVAAIYSHFFVVFLLMAQAISLIVLLSKKNLRLLLRFTISVVAIGILALPIVLLAIKSPEQISWIPSTNLYFFSNLLFEITGSWGGFLTGIYVYALLAGVVIGFVRTTHENDIFEKWKMILLLNCFIFPPVAMTVVSFFKPILVQRYFLFIFAYPAVIVGIGIVAVISSEWKVFKFTGVSVLILILILTGLGARHYFETYQKEDWKGVSKYLSNNCLATGDLRLYYVTWIDSNSLYYNANLKTQSDILEQSLNDEDSAQIAKSIPNNYERVCLVLGQNWAVKDQQQTKIIKTVLEGKYPEVSSIKFYQLEVEIYEKSGP